MSSAKKTEKSRKAKATIARAALKSRTTAAKASKSSAAKARPTRAKARTAATAARAATKTKTARKPASASSKSAAAKLRAAQARAKKQAAAAKAARPAAKSSTAKAAAARKTKTNQNAAATKLKRSTNVSRGKSRAGRNAPVEAKLHKAVAAVQRPAAPQTEPKAVVKKVNSERRAQVAAVLALRSLRKPAPAALPAARPKETSKASVTQKAPKKAAEAAPAPTRVAAPVAPKAVLPSAPVPAAEAQPAVPVIEKPKAAKPAAPVKHGFKPLEFVVYPAHGVGQILAVEEQEVAGFKLELFVISFSKDKMILKVPTPKSIAVGMRKLAGPEVVKHALNTLTGRARIKRTMWSRRAQEYEAKINSGDLVSIAEVVRDLYRSEAQPEQSYSERQLYEAALDRVAREIAAVQKLTETEALKVIDTQLQKSPRRGKADEAEAEAEVSEDGGIDEAA